MWMLDTNICIYLIRQRSPEVLARLRAVDVADVSVSAITVAELEYGVARSARPEHNGIALASFLAPLAVEPFGDDATATYGRVRAELDRRGTPIGALDLLIAAHALALGRTIVTNNEREFSRVSGLKVENWAS